MLEPFVLLLAIMHFGLPLAYYLYVKSRWLPKSWGLRVDESYRPRVTVIIPTYNEADVIKERLNNIYMQKYPRSLVEVIVVDSGSEDGTPELVEEWARQNNDIKLEIVREEVRRGKANALNNALRHVNGEIVVLADADAFWDESALANAVKLFSDPSVGGVSCLKKPLGRGFADVEDSYRLYYNVLRVSESKAFSTPIFHGELAAFRVEHLMKLGGFPTDIGADDSYMATAIAVMGYRSIISDEILCFEAVPGSADYHSWRIRRAQHLVQSFTKTLKLFKNAGKPFKTILLTEAYLHLINPWTLVAAALLLLTATLTGSLIALATVTSGLALLPLKPYRTWITMQLYLVIASLKNIYSREIVWEKQSKLWQYRKPNDVRVGAL